MTLCNFGASHLSLYQLTCERGTVLHQLVSNGEVVLPDSDLSADFFNLTREETAKHGYHQYEVSSFARTGMESKHNQGYWSGNDYIGVGPGAHGCIIDEGIRYRTYRVHSTA
jgi:coproporphyrinogen III oxidase-like Fe-S oxidoreductase